jgi:pyruvate dehydrogenase E2 component (dihydrolipoamide acetyltransferase)
MARWEFKLPDIGEGVTEGEIVQWHVKEGEVVVEDQPMVEVMTDKATVTIGAPRAGRIAQLGGQPGQVIQVHAVLVVFDLDAGAAAVAPTNGHTNGTKPDVRAEGAAEGPKGARKEDGPAATAVGDIRETLPGMSPKASSVRPAAAASGGLATYFNDKPLATPATRKVARDLGVDLKHVKPSGPQGRVTKDDVVAHSRGSAGSAPARGVEAPGPAPSETDERVPFVGMRRRIAARMQQSKNTAAHFTFVEECDATALMSLRARLKPAAEAHGVKLTFLPFIVKAVVGALKRRPILNSTLDEAKNELVYRKSYHIGIAASTDAGLMVPVVKDADRRSLVDLAREIERLGSDAKAGKSKAQDLQGSTFTITSLGAEGGLFATPIINFPEVGILGVHRIKERPVVKDGQIVVGQVMLLSLSFDHRIVDGHVGAAFAYDIIGSLENPERMFLEMV